MARSAGSSSGARSPFEGDRRFTSAMTASSALDRRRGRRGTRVGRAVARAWSSRSSIELGVRRRRGAVLLEDPIEVGGHGGRRPYPRRRDASSATNGAIEEQRAREREEQRTPAASAGDELNSMPGDEHPDRRHERRHGHQRQPAREHHLAAERCVVLEVGQQVVEVGRCGRGAGGAARRSRTRPRLRS